MSQALPSAPVASLALTYSCIIPHPDSGRVLLLPDERGWALPRWAHDGDDYPFWQTVDGVDCALLARFGLDVPPLRCLHVGHDQWRGWVEYVYESEPAPVAWTPPPGGRWFGPRDITGLPLAMPADRALLDRWFAEAVDLAALARRPPWYRPGWYAGATAWLYAQLARLGLPAIGPPERLRSWERSCLLRAPTAEGWVYLKAVPPIFAHEPPLTGALARAHPGAIPTILARDDTRHWMLMADFGGVGLDRVREVERWAAVIRRFAAIQTASVPRTVELRALGCPARPVRALPAGLAALLADTAALLPGAPGGLTAAEIDGLRALAPRLVSECAELACAAVPETLEHGDFWAGNVAATDFGYVLFDWSDSALTHPFFSLALFLADAARAFPDDPGLGVRLRDAYLAPWAAYARRDELARQFALARRLAPLHHAVAYHRDILPTMAARWEMERMVPFYLRMLLAPAPADPP